MHLLTALRRSFLSALLVVVACADDPTVSNHGDVMPTAPSATRASPATTTGVPIQGRLTGTVSATRLSETELIYRLQNTAFGTISHLGRSRADWVVPEMVFDPMRQQVRLPITHWTGTMTAANGDKIFGEYRFRASVLQFSLLGELKAVADLTIVGGTGRFKGVTGSGTSTISGNVWTERFSIGVQGEIFGIGR